jgi:hypothetical protein
MPGGSRQGLGFAGRTIKFTLGVLVFALALSAGAFAMPSRTVDPDALWNVVHVI